MELSHEKRRVSKLLDSINAKRSKSIQSKSLSLGLDQNFRRQSNFDFQPDLSMQPESTQSRTI